MSRKFDPNNNENNKVFKTYNKFKKDNFGNKSKDPRALDFDPDTYYNYLLDGCAFIRNVSGVDVSKAPTKKAMKKLLTDNHGAILKSLEATGYQSSSHVFRKRRKFLEVLFKAAGLSDLANKIKHTKNKTPISDRVQNIKKSRRINKVTDDMFGTLKDALNFKEDQEMLDVICLIKSFGMRPSELLKCKVVSQDDANVTIFIEGAKKTLTGKKLKNWERGIDRTLTVSSTEEIRNALKVLNTLDQHRIEAIQSRLYRTSRKLFNNSDKQLCLYSFRYTFGSNLKRQLYQAEGGRIIAAAIMGHKNTTSISSYGHFRSGKIGVEIPSVDEATIRLVQDDIGERFGKAGKNFDVGEAIRNRKYTKPEPKMDFSP